MTTADGIRRRADVLIWATGFDVNHQLGPIDVRGLDGLALNDTWGDAAYAYPGITVPGFPNFFCIYGPGTNAVNGASIIYNSECQMRYIMGCIDMVLAGGVRSAMPRADVCDDYNRRNQDRLKTMVYTHPKVVSYYKTRRVAFRRCMASELSTTGSGPTLLTRTTTTCGPKRRRAERNRWQDGLLARAFCTATSKSISV